MNNQEKVACAVACVAVIFPFVLSISAFNRAAYYRGKIDARTQIYNDLKGVMEEIQNTIDQQKVEAE